jgi:hypothetical protein
MFCNDSTLVLEDAQCFNFISEQSSNIFDINIFSNKKGGKENIYNKIASLSQKHFAYLGLSLADTQRNKNKNKKKAFGQTFGMEKRFVSIIYF